ncbi:MAG: SGNH/GDSL hydrolase family protein, partial [Gammaproteobacteria bacterium]|nr:SGNH/GDSL hydrolase family protein [Gammaproteobacteria bacterium]
MALAGKRVSQLELIEMVMDLDVSDEELTRYFIVDEQHSEGFKPRVIANPELVKQSDPEGAFTLNSLNHLARNRRNRKYRRRIRNWGGVRIVAEGDSWFQYPLLLQDTIDQLINLDNFQYAIYGLSGAGDLLSNIVREDEISEAIERENPDVLLLSGGGNDLVGDGRLSML